MVSQRCGHLGTTHTDVPDPLGMVKNHQHGAIGANQTVINSIYPQLLPLIKASNRLDGIVDAFAAMGGRTDWNVVFPAKCDLDSPWASCGWWCDEQSCDQCHPNNAGYTHMARAVQAGLGLL